jgi:hypothetical protein
MKCRILNEKSGSVSGSGKKSGSATYFFDNIVNRWSLSKTFPRISNSGLIDLGVTISSTRKAHNKILQFIIAETGRGSRD